MATADPTPDIIASPAESPAGSLLVMIAAMPAEQLASLLSHLSTLFPSQSLIVAAPEEVPADTYPALRMVATPAPKLAMTLTAADFASAHLLAEQHDAQAILMMGPESGSLSGDVVRKLATAV